jgi:hypothetical protein
LGASQQVISYNLTKLVRDEKLRIVRSGRENSYYINLPEVSLPTYQDQTQPMTPVQLQQTNISSQMNINQSQYPPQPTISPIETQIQIQNQPRLPPRLPEQINSSDPKKINRHQE